MLGASALTVEDASTAHVVGPGYTGKRVRKVPRQSGAAAWVASGLRAACNVAPPCHSSVRCSRSQAVAAARVALLRALVIALPALFDRR